MFKGAFPNPVGAIIKTHIWRNVGVILAVLATMINNSNKSPPLEANFGKRWVGTLSRLAPFLTRIPATIETTVRDGGGGLDDEGNVHRSIH